METLTQQRLRNNSYHLVIRSSLLAIQSTLSLQATMLQSDHATFTDIKATIATQNTALQNTTKILVEYFSKISSYQPPPLSPPRQQQQLVTVNPQAISSISEPHLISSQPELATHHKSAALPSPKSKTQFIPQNPQAQITPQSFSLPQQSQLQTQQQHFVPAYPHNPCPSLLASATIAPVALKSSTIPSIGSTTVSATLTDLTIRLSSYHLPPENSNPLPSLIQSATTNYPNNNIDLPNPSDQDNQTEQEVSSQVLMGISDPKSIQQAASLFKQSTVALVDSGSLINFLHPLTAPDLLSSFDPEHFQQHRTKISEIHNKNEGKMMESHKLFVEMIERGKKSSGYHLCLNGLNSGQNLVYGNELKVGNNICICGIFLEHEHACLSYAATECENVDLVRNLGFMSVLISKTNVIWKDSDLLVYVKVPPENKVNIGEKKEFIFDPGDGLNMAQLAPMETKRCPLYLNDKMFQLGIELQLHGSMLGQNFNMLPDHSLITNPMAFSPSSLSGFNSIGGQFIISEVNSSSSPISSLLHVRCIKIKSGETYIFDPGGKFSWKSAFVVRLMQGDVQQIFKLRLNSNSTIPTTLPQTYDLEDKVDFEGMVMIRSNDTDPATLPQLGAATRPNECTRISQFIKACRHNL